MLHWGYELTRADADAYCKLKGLPKVGFDSTPSPSPSLALPSSCMRTCLLQPTSPSSFPPRLLPSLFPSFSFSHSVVAQCPPPRGKAEDPAEIVNKFLPTDEEREAMKANRKEKKKKNKEKKRKAKAEV